MASKKEKNYYEIFGIAPNASPAEIKKAYQELARLYHPDSNFYTEIVEDTLTGEHLQKFQEITSIYSVLIHPQKRAEYDRSQPLIVKGVPKPEATSAARYREASAQDGPRATAFGTFGKHQAPSSTSTEGAGGAENRRMSEVIKTENSIFNRIVGLFVNRSY